MKRRIIKIDEEKCNGCGACVDACHEGAIGLVNGKAKLLRDDYCDGLGDCLPSCPTQAISFEERDALPFNAQGCPGSMARSLAKGEEIKKDSQLTQVASQLTQWPVQIKLVPINAPYFENANLLVAADCAAYAYGNFHHDFIKNHVVVIGCPKLDEGDYSEKLTQILAFNNIKSLTIVRMEVPCCGGLEYAAKEALRKSGKFIPWQVVTLSIEGERID